MNTLTGLTTRPVTFRVLNALDHPAVEVQTLPTGTVVYVTLRADGDFNVRVPGTLLEQDVDPASVEPV